MEEPRTGASTPGVVSLGPKGRGRITSIDLMATLFLKQPKMPLATFAARAHFNISCSTCLPGPTVHILPSHVPARRPTTGSGTQAYSSPVQDTASPFLEPHEISGSPFFQVIEVPLNLTAQQSGVLSSQQNSNPEASNGVLPFLNWRWSKQVVIWNVCLSVMADPNSIHSKWNR